MKVLIRADGSSAIGIGHLMRSLALAQALRDGADEVTLLTAVDLGPLASQWEQEGVTVDYLEAEIGSTEDARRTSTLARGIGAGWLVLDGYSFDGSYRSALDLDARLMIVDDHGAVGLGADLVVNGNLYGLDAMYPALDGRLLAGPRYAMLRREFRSPARAAHRGGILLTLGGADPEQRTAAILDALSARGLKGRVVIGPRQRSPDALSALASALGWEPLEAPDEMSALLQSAGIAIVGSGSTTLECAALGVPMVAVRIADNQIPVAAALEALGLAAIANGDDPAGVTEAAAALADDPARQAAMAAAGPRLVDGRGALRAAGAMREALMKLRPATRGDARVLHRWRNDGETRAASLSSAAVPWGEHVAWLDRSLGSPDTRLLVGELEGAPIGVVRIDRNGESATISVTVAPEARSRGLATPLIRAGVQAAAALGVERVIALIRRENTASISAFQAAGFGDAVVAPGEAAPPKGVLVVTALTRPR